MPNPVTTTRRQAVAFQRIITAAGRLAGPFEVNDQVAALRNTTARDPAYAQMLQTEAIADLLDALARSEAQQVKGTDLRAAVLHASDDELIAIPGIGEKSLVQVREWAKEQPAETPQQPQDAPEGDDSTDAPLTVETVTEKPLETIETVQIVEPDVAPVVPRRSTGKRNA